MSWTKTPNWIGDNVSRFSGTGLKILTVMARAQYGYTGFKGFWSVRKLAEKVDLGKSQVHRELSRLIDAGIVTVISTGPRRARKFHVPMECPANLTVPIMNQKKGINVSPRKLKTVPSVQPNCPAIEGTRNRTLTETEFIEIEPDVSKKLKGKIWREAHQRFPDKPWTTRNWLYAKMNQCIDFYLEHGHCNSYGANIHGALAIIVKDEIGDAA